MTVAEAKKVIEDVDWYGDSEDYGSVDDLYEGLTILKRYSKGKPLQYNFQHDQAWFGAEDMDFEAYVRIMSNEDIRRMGNLGWFEDEDSWSLFS